MTQHRVLVISAVLARSPRSRPRRAPCPTGARRSRPRPPPGPRPQRRPEIAYDRVAHFYGAYIDVAHDPGSNAAAAELRKFYLTPALRTRLLDWEKRHDADGILMAQNVPDAWKVTRGRQRHGQDADDGAAHLGRGQGPYVHLSGGVSRTSPPAKITDIKSKY